jgi:L-threonylcarbamoyladenylate synthase
MKLDKVIQSLNNGEVISFPTETVYGLGCDAINDNAVKKIYELKQRAYSKPLAIFFKNIQEAEKYLLFNKEAKILAKKFMPGEITLVLKRKKESNLSSFLNVNTDSLGFRIPNHKLCLEILEKFGRPLCVTSANISDKETSVTSEDVKKYFGDKIYIIESSGQKSSNQASTIIDLSGKKIEFVRQGSISFDEIRNILKKTK